MNLYDFKIFTTAFTTAELATDVQNCLSQQLPRTVVLYDPDNPSQAAGSLTFTTVLT